jgi:hypothetical protein
VNQVIKEMNEHNIKVKQNIGTMLHFHLAFQCYLDFVRVKDISKTFFMQLIETVKHTE